MPHNDPVDPCKALFGALKKACQNTQQMVGPSGGATPGTTTGGTSSPTLGQAITDPLGSIARGCAEAAQWVIDHLSTAISSTATVNFTNIGFLKQYAIVFAASAVLTVLLWLLSVVKRAIRGDSVVTAIGEATGFLWMAVLASAFTPVILAGVVKVTDSISNAIATGSSSDTNGFLTSFSKALDPNSGLGGGPIMLIFVSILSMIAAALLWLELLIRAAMLYVGAALATAVYAGFVDKSMWGHIRRWVGLMISIDLIKPIIVIVLSLATAISSGTPGDSFSAVLSGLAIMILSIFASGLVYRFVPAFGDEMLALNKERAAKIGTAAISSAAFQTPAGTMKSGIATHGARGGGAFAGGGAGNMGAAVTGLSTRALGAGASAAAGVAAHGARALTTKGDATGGSGGSGAGGGGASPTSPSRLQATPAQVVPKPPPPPRGST